MASVLTKCVKFGTSSWTMLSRGFSLQSVKCSVYPREFLDAPKDPQFYREEIDPLYMHSEIKAAPHQNTYSNFYSYRVGKTEQMVQKQSKAYLAQRIVQKALEDIKLTQVEKYHKVPKEEQADIELNPQRYLDSAFESVMPKIGVRPYRKGAQTYQVPYALPQFRQQALVYKWMLTSIRLKRQTTKFHQRLANEIMAAKIGQGAAMKNKQALHKMADANRAYAHLRWKKSNVKKKMRGRKGAKASTGKFGSR